MHIETRHITRQLGALFVLVMVGWLANIANAQGSDFKPYVAALTQDDVFVHSGADSRYYPFGVLDAGDLVQITEEKSGWARVATAGAAFDGMFGYIKYPRTDTGRFRLDADKKTGVTLGMMDLIAPNMNEGFAPEQSWKPLGRKLAAATTLRVFETIDTERETVHKVALPADSSGWVNMLYLRKATDAEVASWEAALGSTVRPVIESPKTTPDVQPVTPRPMDPLPDINPMPGQDAGSNGAPPLDGTQQSDASIQTGPVTTDTGEEEEDFNRWHEQLLDLEDAYKAMTAAPPASAEVGPLRTMYEELAASAVEVEPVISRFAERRVAQLTLWARAQEAKDRAARLSQRVQVATEDFDAAKMAIAMSGDYVAAGKLEASLVYNGRSLPELYRIQDVVSGRTIAYIKPDPEFKLAGLLGQTIGVAGEIEYDGTLRVNMVVPRHIDVLSPKN